MGHNLPFDIDALLVFAKVVECRSLSKAASLLGMPKSTASRKMRIPAMADTGSGDGGHHRSVATQAG